MRHGAPSGSRTTGTKARKKKAFALAEPSGSRPTGDSDIVQGLGLPNDRTGNPYILRGGQDTDQLTQGILQVLGVVPARPLEA